jgi:DNA-binding beta-propeller fold protein YncE
VKFALVPDWEQLPPGWSHGDVAGVACDSRNRVYVFNRSEHPVIVYESDGRFVGSWGEGVFTRPHGITIHDDVVYCADDTDHTVRGFTLDGTLLWTLGTPGVPSDTGYSPQGRANLLSIKRGAGPFNRPTRLAVAPNGDLYVSDGYGNARVHKFSADAKYLSSWGEPGTAPGQFNLPHGVWIDRRGRVLVADRENDRVQVFDQTGKLLEVWPTELIGPAFFYVDAEDTVYIPEHNGGFISVLTLDGERLARWGDGPVNRSCHGIWCDSRRDLYVVQPGEWGRVRRVVKYHRQ